jgi:hypothetical protein
MGLMANAILGWTWQSWASLETANHVQFWHYDQKYWKQQEMVAENEKKSKGLI